MKDPARWAVLAALLVGRAPAAAQTALPLKHAPQSTTAAITPADLMTRLYIYADDSMMGRRGGTEWNLKATAYIASEVKRMGLVPMGDSGTYFQWVPLVNLEFDTASTIAVGAVTLKAGQDFIVRPTRAALRSISGAQAVYAGVLGDSNMLAPEQAAGRVVVVSLPPGGGGGGIVGRYRGAGGIAVVSLDRMAPGPRAFFRGPATVLKTSTERADTTTQPLVLQVSVAAARALLGMAPDSAKPGALGAILQGTVRFIETPAPARNVVAVVPGSDAGLKGEYVAIGAHNDHIGFTHTPVDHDSLRAFNTARLRLTESLPAGRRLTPELLAGIHVNVDSLHRLHPARADSIDNGADDDGSGTVSALEIAEQFAAARQRPKRSILFVWHTGEELGLLGSRWFTDHPTVPRDSIVAQLNMDMVGRGDTTDLKGGGPDYLQLVGSGRLSTELGDLVESVNKAEPHPLALDYAFDAPGHPERIYCRSDHYMYARYGIPITFFTTGLHADYHQVTDEPQYIDYEHMARVDQLVYDVAVQVANLGHRLVVDKPKPDPTAPCVQ